MTKCFRRATPARGSPVLLRWPDSDPPRNRPAPAGSPQPWSKPMTRTAVFFAIALVIAAESAIAGDYNAGSITIGNPWTRATPKGATVAGAYMTISNKGTAPDRLVGGSSAVAG